MEHLINFTASNSSDTEVGTNELSSWDASDLNRVKAYLEREGFENVEVLDVKQA